MPADNGTIERFPRERSRSPVEWEVDMMISAIKRATGALGTAGLLFLLAPGMAQAQEIVLKTGTSWNDKFPMAEMLSVAGHQPEVAFGRPHGLGCPPGQELVFGKDLRRAGRARPDRYRHRVGLQLRRLLQDLRGAHAALHLLRRCGGSVGYRRLSVRPALECLCGTGRHAHAGDRTLPGLPSAGDRRGSDQVAGGSARREDPGYQVATRRCADPLPGARSPRRSPGPKPTTRCSRTWSAASTSKRAFTR